MAFRLDGANPLSEPMLEYWPLGTNFSEILIEIHSFSLKKMQLKMPSGKWRPFCVGLEVLNNWGNIKDNMERNYKLYSYKVYIAMSFGVAVTLLTVRPWWHFFIWSRWRGIRIYPILHVLHDDYITWTCIAYMHMYISIAYKHVRPHISPLRLRE